MNANKITANTRHLDVLIIGAGISGIGAACHLQTHCPDKRYAIIEGRSAIGGTWDLFRYPGIRSDSDMYTFGFNFKPWKSRKAISPGADIREYLAEAATENGIDKHIEFGRRVVAADWNSATARWTVQIKIVATGNIENLTCSFLFSCGGYYNYDHGYTPHFEGSESFRGQIIHPQHWPEDLDYTGKKIVVVGSGATAVTLVPTLASTAAGVTMLQRSPTYIMSRPQEDAIANFLQRWLPDKIAYGMVRWKNVLLGMLIFHLAKRRPERLKRWIINGVRDALGPDYDVETHFTPRYQPWDQRLCLIPDGDLFAAIKNGSVTVVTDRIDKFVPNGILLQSGDVLDADLIVTATGLKAEVFSGLQLSVDQEPVHPSTRYCYKGMMLSGLPNFAFAVGYTNASWTLKSDLVGEYVCRLLNHMDKKRYDFCIPTLPADGIEEEPLLDFTSGYVLRALDQLPKQGKKKPWKLYQNYFLDRLSLHHGSVVDSSIRFSRIGDDSVADSHSRAGFFGS